MNQAVCLTLATRVVACLELAHTTTGKAIDAPGRRVNALAAARNIRDALHLARELEHELRHG